MWMKRGRLKASGIGINFFMNTTSPKLGHAELQAFFSYSRENAAVPFDISQALLNYGFEYRNYEKPPIIINKKKEEFDPQFFISEETALHFLTQKKAE